MTGKKFASIRKELGITQKALPDLIGHAHRTIQDWEASDKIPDYAEKVILLLEEKLSPKNTGEQEIEKLKSDIKKQEKYITSLEKNIEHLEYRLLQYETKAKRASS